MSKKVLKLRFDFWHASALLNAATGIKALGLLENAAAGVVQFEKLTPTGEYAPVSLEECREELSFGDPMTFYSSPVAVHGFTLTQDELEQLLPEGMTLGTATQLAALANDAEVAAIVAKVRAMKELEKSTASNQVQTVSEKQSTYARSLSDNSSALASKGPDLVRDVPWISAARELMSGNIESVLWTNDSKPNFGAVAKRLIRDQMEYPSIKDRPPRNDDRLARLLSKYDTLWAPLKKGCTYKTRR